MTWFVINSKNQQFSFSSAFTFALTIEWLIDASYRYLFAYQCIFEPISIWTRFFRLSSSSNFVGKIDFWDLFFSQFQLTPFGMAILINYWNSFATKSISKGFVIAISFFSSSNLQLSKLPIQIFIDDAINFTEKKLFIHKSSLPFSRSSLSLGLGHEEKKQAPIFFCKL